MTTLTALIENGKSLGLTGQELRDWVKLRDAEEKEERREEIARNKEREDKEREERRNCNAVTTRAQGMRDKDIYCQEPQIDTDYSKESPSTDRVMTELDVVTETAVGSQKKVSVNENGRSLDEQVGDGVDRVRVDESSFRFGLKAVKHIMSVLARLFQWTMVSCFMVTLTGSIKAYSSAVRNPYQQMFLSQFQRYLSLIEFDTREACVRVMCAPRKSRLLDQRMTFSGRGNLLPFQNSIRSPQSQSESAAFNDLRNVLKSDSHIITDGHNNAIGMVADPDGGGNNSRYENPPSVYPYVPPRPVERTGGSMGGEYPLSIPSVYPPPATTGKPVKPSVPSAETNICCSTIESYFINSTLVDLTGTTRTIAQVKHIGTYQIIRHGFCGKRGVCPGICDQVYVVLPLAIYPNDPGQTVTYRYFQIPGYCSCKVPA
ncbi:hypothetical protein Btru_061692 [Bulinus truncatus]|nr:hypothetical protein Btru_061692 [Bulinus truncatus]